MKKSILLFSLAAMTLSACSSPQTAFRPGVAVNPRAPLTAQNASKTEKEPKPLIENRQVEVTLSGFDNVAEQNLNKTYASDTLFAVDDSISAQSPFDSPFGSLPFENYSDFSDHIRYSSDTVYEDRKYMSDRYARGHFNKYINSAYRQVQNLYKPSRTEMKRFILLDVLANALSVSGRTLPYQDVHNPPAERHYKLFPTKAAMLMPTFGEIMDYNRSSYDVNYVRWDAYRAARYYQANYSRIFGLIMEHGPSRRDAWKMVHREISTYANR